MSEDVDTVEAEKRDLKKGAMQILSGFGVRIVARIILLSFVARVYGVSDFGRLGETVAIVELLAAFSIFGINKTLLGEMKRDDEDILLASKVMDAIVLTSLISGTITIIMWFVWPFLSTQSLSTSQFVLLGIPLIAVAEVATTGTRHFRTVFWDTLVKALIKPWSFLLLAVAAYYLLIGSTVLSSGTISSEQALLAAYTGSLLLTTIFAVLVLARFFGSQGQFKTYRPTLDGVLGLARRSWPIALNETGLFAFRRIDIIILAAVAGPKATGVYYLAQQIGTIVEKVRYLFEPMLAPIVAQSPSISTVAAHLRRLALFIFSTQLAIILIVAIAGNSVLQWFEMNTAGALFVILAILFGELLDGTFGLCELPMVYRHPAWPPRLVGVALALEITLVWMWAEPLGALGAALGFAATMFVLALMRLVAVRRLYGMKMIGRVAEA